MIASKQVGDPEHLTVFAAADGAAKWFGNDPEGVASICSGMNRIGRRTAYAMLVLGCSQLSGSCWDRSSGPSIHKV